MSISKTTRASIVRMSPKASSSFPPQPARHPAPTPTSILRAVLRDQYTGLGSAPRRLGGRPVVPRPVLPCGLLGAGALLARSLYRRPMHPPALEGEDRSRHEKAERTDDEGDDVAHQHAARG